jgi:hypothetical protein
MEAYNEWAGGACYDTLPSVAIQEPTELARDEAKGPRPRRNIPIRTAVKEVLDRKADRLAQKRKLKPG